MPVKLLEKGSVPLMLTVPRGARRFPERRRSRVVLPAPFAPMRRVRLPAGRCREMSVRPGCEVFGKR